MEDLHKYKVLDWKVPNLNTTFIDASGSVHLGIWRARIFTMDCTVMGRLGGDRNIACMSGEVGGHGKIK